MRAHTLSEKFTQRSVHSARICYDIITFRPYYTCFSRLIAYQMTFPRLMNVYLRGEGGGANNICILRRRRIESTCFFLCTKARPRFINYTFNRINRIMGVQIIMRVPRTRAFCYPLMHIILYDRVCISLVSFFNILALGDMRYK